jgi:hypothetical protein
MGQESISLKGFIMSKIKTSNTEAEIAAAALELKTLKTELPEIEAALEKAQADETKALGMTEKVKAHTALQAIAGVLEAQTSRIRETLEKVTGLEARKRREWHEAGIRQAALVSDEAVKGLEKATNDLEAAIRLHTSKARAFAQEIDEARSNAMEHGKALAIPSGELPVGWENTTQAKVIEVLGKTHAVALPWGATYFDANRAKSMLSYIEAGARPEELPQLMGIKAPK